ncbi:hypothetical protein HYS31_03390 [Candidatus Woesearchaeota archaeon]|nr:hypothetical protein [Candidatus Woesearchaeota archaeon]
MIDNKREEFYFLTERLQEIDAALEGNCNDIDCDKYIYKYCLKKIHKPVLRHGFSCTLSLKREKEAIMRIVSLTRYKKCRYLKCTVCGKKVDSLGKECSVVSFTRPCGDKGYVEYKGIYAHKKCKRKVAVPDGWKRW